MSVPPGRRTSKREAGVRRFRSGWSGAGPKLDYAFESPTRPRMTDHSIGDPCELAALYAAGAMNDAERVGFETHLAQGCALCDAELAGFTSVVTALADMAGREAPSPTVRPRLLSKLGNLQGPHSSEGSTQVWKNWRPDPIHGDLLVVRKDQGGWEETGVAGVRVRRLLVDTERNQFTGLIQMDAGAAYPRHVHNGPEECLVLEGDLHVGETVLNAGDYQFAPPGSLHGIQSTERGCLLLITSSLTDELV